MKSILHWKHKKIKCVIKAKTFQVFQISITINLKRLCLEWSTQTYLSSHWEISRGVIRVHPLYIRHFKSSLLKVSSSSFFWISDSINTEIELSSVVISLLSIWNSPLSFSVNKIGSTNVFFCLRILKQIFSLNFMEIWLKLFWKILRFFDFF